MKKYTIKENQQFIGEFSREDDVNGFISSLMDAADENGSVATLKDKEGCEVTASVNE